MYTPSRNKNTEKGRTFLLLEKRNAQFHSVFLRLKDPVTIIQAYTAVSKVHAKYFGRSGKPDVWVQVLLWVYDKNFFFVEEAVKQFGISRPELNKILMSMGHKHLLDVEKGRQPHLYKMSADGHLFLQNFTKECNSAIMQTVRNGRTGKKKITSTIKKKKIKK